jgi:hypothetical protein
MPKKSTLIPPKGIPLPVVYTMGKVGSQAVSRAIRASGLPNLHVHYLRWEAVVQQLSKYLREGQLPPDHLLQSMAFHSSLLDKRACVYISLVRDPIARNLSAFFQNYRRTLNGMEGAQDAFKAFLKNYPHRLPTHWLDTEFGKALGVNVYEVPFDKTSRASIWKGMIIMRDDCPDETKGALLSELLGRTIKISRVNVGSDKPYAQLYKEVRNLARFNADFLDSLYDTKFARHFWTDDELSRLRDFWLGLDRT